jgi:hypothetical protein
VVTASTAAFYNERVAIVLGIITLLLALAVFASCRTFVTTLARIGIKNIAANPAYRAFNKWHLYYWWFFGVFVLAHLTMGTIHTGLPQSGDPDAPVHWAILGLGLSSVFAGTTVFLSCRVTPKLVSHRIPKLSLNNKNYLEFFRNHAYFWLIFVIMAAAHIGVVFQHAGIWPR